MSPESAGGASLGHVPGGRRRPAPARRPGAATTRPAGTSITAGWVSAGEAANASSTATADGVPEPADLPPVDPLGAHEPDHQGRTATMISATTRPEPRARRGSPASWRAGQASGLSMPRKGPSGPGLGRAVEHAQRPGSRGHDERDPPERREWTAVRQHLRVDRRHQHRGREPRPVAHPGGRHRQRRPGGQGGARVAVRGRRRRTTSRRRRPRPSAPIAITSQPIRKAWARPTRMNPTTENASASDTSGVPSRSRR